jgi:hypothetical protein
MLLFFFRPHVYEQGAVTFTYAFKTAVERIRPLYGLRMVE